jgi:replicative DNA helicase
MDDNNQAVVFTGPHSIEAERAVLGAVLIGTLDSKPPIERLEFLSPDSFFLVKHGIIFNAMQRLHSRGEDIDNISVAEELKTMPGSNAALTALDEIGGSNYLVLLINTNPTALHAEVYGHIVHRMALRRKLLEAASAIAKLANDKERDINEVFKEASLAVNDIASTDIRATYTTHAEEAQALVEWLENGSPEFIGMGLKDFDRAVGGGIQPAQLFVIGAVTKWGKTRVMMQWAINAARMGKRVLVVTREMTSQQMFRRILQMETTLQQPVLDKLDPASSADITLAKSYAEVAKKMHIIYDRDSATPSDIRASLKRVTNEHGTVDLVVIDYTQIMHPDQRIRGQNRYAVVGDVMLGIKDIARDMQVAILTAAQLNVDGSVYESQKIEQWSEVVVKMQNEAGGYTRDMVIKDEDGRNKTVEFDPAESGVRILAITHNRNGYPRKVPVYYSSVEQWYYDIAPEGV